MKDWSKLPGAKETEPPIKLEADKGRLKMTFAGGSWPTR